LELMADQRFDVILSDIRMPDLDGPALYAQASRQWPGIERQFGFFTGDSLSPAASRFLKDTDVPMVEKPFTRAGLQALIEDVLARSV
ncbi:MAG: response regulator, partial [Pseudomonadota bacterium]